jgi:hypothetical protein
LSSSVDVWGPAERLSGSTSSGVIRDALLVTFGNVVFRQSSFLEFVLFGNVAFGHSTFGNGGDSSVSGDLKKEEMIKSTIAKIDRIILRLKGPH